MDEIRADYDQLEQIAGRFVQQAEVVQQMVQRVRASMEKLESGGWMGLGADAFFEEMQGEVLPACQRLYDVLSDAGQATKDIVQLVRQAEADACAPFKGGH